MPYFIDHYDAFRYPLKTAPPAGQPAPKEGFRPSQLGAIHAVAGHFTTRSAPAVVVMPTGTGKTAVLLALPFVLRATRVLVVVPSRLLRDQIAAGFKQVGPLREIGALPKGKAVRDPAVKRVIGRLSTVQDWEDLRQFDVVVATPASASPSQPGVADPPADLFDLVLVDEAHHEPAVTWRTLTRAFAARVALCSATPFRRDGCEISGRIVFHYPLRNARDDGSFADIDYLPTTGGDIPIANEVERQLASDRAAGFDHHVLIRTDRRSRAEELLKMYEAETKLRLAVVHGAHGAKKIAQVLKAVRDGSLDGVIAVNIMGEGIDLPTLKVAGGAMPRRSSLVHGSRSHPEWKSGWPTEGGPNEVIPSFRFQMRA